MMRGDAGLPTTAQILASKPLYVFGGAAQLVVGACDIGVALIFYGLLKPVSRGLALLAAFFRLVFVAIASANVFNHFAPLLLLSGAAYLNAFKPDQLQALALVFIRLRTIGFDIPWCSSAFIASYSVTSFSGRPSSRVFWAYCWRLGG
jgi:hypothetical protein